VTGLVSQAQAAGAGSGLIPPGSTAFHLLLAVHIPAGLTGVVTGAVAALSPKRHGRHRQFGTVYYWALSVVFATAAALAVLGWPQDAYLLVLGTLSFALASLGRTARRHHHHHHHHHHQWQRRNRRWMGWVGPHITGMSTSYIVLLIAFYLDNGKNLPLWRDLPHLTYWLLPTTIGIPLVVRALRHYRSLAPRHRGSTTNHGMAH
jgi:hypothetical protein